jgi:hypothetical protein
MTNLLLLIGAGLFSNAVGSFEKHAFANLVGSNLDDTAGDGPGTYRVKGNVWHLDCCNPENNFDGQGWSIFSAILGWTNNATCMFFNAFHPFFSTPQSIYSTNYYFFWISSRNCSFVCVLLACSYSRTCLYQI